MQVALIDYGSGNLRSAEKALQAAADSQGGTTRISRCRDADQLLAADRVVLPGVGAFADCRRGLASLDGMLDALNIFTQQLARPFLGICVGMQLTADQGQENGITPGFGWIRGEIVPLQPVDADGKRLKVPHIGWNRLLPTRPAHPLFNGISPSVDAEASRVYFVHGYHLVGGDADTVLAETDYGGRITAAVCRATMAGFQFHPEKSQAVGQQLLVNWLNWRP